MWIKCHSSQLSFCFFHTLICVVIMDQDLLFGIATGGDQVRILSYAAEGVPITRTDVHNYQSQLVAVRQQASSQTVKPLIGLLSAVENPAAMPTEAAAAAPVQRRAFGLSDEGQSSMSSAHAVAGVDKAEIHRIMQQLQLDIDPIHRAWATQQQQAAEASNYYNFGLNERLLREYIEAQIALRIDRSRRVKLVGSTDVAGNRQHAQLRQHHQPPPVQQQAPTYHDPWKV